MIRKSTGSIWKPNGDAQSGNRTLNERDSNFEGWADLESSGKPH